MFVSNDYSFLARSGLYILRFLSVNSPELGLGLRVRLALRLGC